MHCHSHTASLRACCLAVVVIVTLCFQSGYSRSADRSFDEDWPKWRGPRGDGTWNAPRLPDRWPDSGLKQIWSIEIGGGYSGVIVSGNRVLTMDRRVERGPTNSADDKSPGPILSERERVLCFDRRSGNEIWAFGYPEKYGDLEYGNGPRSAPTVHGDFVLTLGTMGKLHCLSLATGRRLWSHDLIEEFGGRLPMWGYAASPLVYRATVVVAAGGKDGYSMLAFDLKSGELKWHSLSDEAGYSWPLLVSRPDHDQMICWTPSHIRGIDATNGSPLWSVPYEVTYGVSIATPIIHQDLVLVSGYWKGSKAIRLGAKSTDASLAWEDERHLRGLMSQPLYRDGFVYLLDKQYGITCFNLQTGTKRWDDGNTLTPRARNPQASLVWLNDEDRIIALNENGELVLARINPNGYSEQSRTKIIGRTWAHPAFAGRFVIARSDSKLVCVELPVNPE